MTEYTSATIPLTTENIQTKKANNNLRQVITQQQLVPETIKEELTSGNGLNQFVCIRYT